MLFRSAVLLSGAALFSIVVAQASVPSSLSSGFDTDAITLQVSFTGDASTGFSDGTSISSQEASNTPSFALGDASGVNTAISFVILMIDTTSSSSNPTLHYIQADFKASGDETQISSSSSAAVSYSKPGAFGETGTRNYVFLLYQQLGSLKTLPKAGQSFDINSFQSSNGLKDAKAGTAMSVDLGGSNSDGGNQQQSSAAQQQTTEAAPSATQQASSQEQPQQTTFETAASPSAAASTSAAAAATSSLAIESIISTAVESASASALPTAAASVGAAGAGPVGGAASSIPASDAGTGVIQPTGGAGATPSASSSATPTGAAGRLNLPVGKSLGALVGLVAVGVMI